MSSEKLNTVRQILRQMGSVLVAYSRGISLDLSGYRTGSPNLIP
jgi:hypothetical protein